VILHNSCYAANTFRSLEITFKRDVETSLIIALSKREKSRKPRNFSTQPLKAGLLTNASLKGQTVIARRFNGGLRKGFLFSRLSFFRVFVIQYDTKTTPTCFIPHNMIYISAFRRLTSGGKKTNRTINKRQRMLSL